LEHGKDDLYDVFTVSEVMSTPPVVVREKERASQLVKILKSTAHNG
jgi:CBS domain-containing protein